MQLAVIGDVGAGKTSLVRSLSGEAFQGERHETHGIDTSMVEMTELDSSWNLVDLHNSSHLDDILADMTSECIKSASKRNVAAQRSTSQEITPYLPPGSRVDEQHMNPFIFPEVPAEQLSQAADSSDRSSIVPVSAVPEEEKKPDRQMPVKKIAQNLSRESSEDSKLYAKISIWDFAGHQLYETMHHIFLNSRSFYLVVFSLVKLKNSEGETLETLRFWLNSVRVHTPRSTPMFLVGTHRDQVEDADVDRAEQATYDAFFQGFGQQLVPSKDKCYLFAVDNPRGSDDSGAVNLKKMIEKEAHRLEHVEEKLPVRWLHFEEEILRRHQSTEEPRCVLKERVRKMCEEIEVMRDDEFDGMLQFFHDSGVIILPGEINPFTPKSDQCQISPAASPKVLHHTVWRTWLFIG